jgi:hypothetical protein
MEALRYLRRQARRMIGTFRDETLPRLRSFRAHALHRLGRKPRADRRRLLMIYDLATQPFSIGDILVAQAASLVLREENDLDQVDFVVVYDPRKPACADPAFSSINEENVLYHLASILPAAQVNQHLGSVLCFNSHEHLMRYVCDNCSRYLVWPHAWHPTLQGYHYYTIYNDLIARYHRRHGHAPRLECRPIMADWARRFYREHVLPDVPVSIQIRNNPRFHHYRNSRLECWHAFFEDCRDRYPVKFVVVCSHAEVDPRLRSHDNVILAKDHGTVLEQDLALLQTSAMHMGASSGPGFFVTFGTRPYLLTNTDMIPERYDGLQREGNLLRFAFASPLQQISIGVETTPFLIREFERMWAAIDDTSWHQSVGSESPVQLAETWLR